MILTNTISVPELLWTLVSLIAAFFVSRPFRRSLETVKWLKKFNLNGVRRDAAMVSVFTFGALLFIVSMNSLAGIIAMTIPSASPESVHPLTYMIAAIFITKSTFVAIISYIIDRLQSGLITTLTKKGT